MQLRAAWLTVYLRRAVASAMIGRRACRRFRCIDKVTVFSACGVMQLCGNAALPSLLSFPIPSIFFDLLLQLPTLSTVTNSNSGSESRVFSPLPAHQRQAFSSLDKSSAFFYSLVDWHRKVLTTPYERTRLAVPEETPSTRIELRQKAKKTTRVLPLSVTDTMCEDRRGDSCLFSPLPRFW